MRRILVLLSALVSLSSNAQNIVSNPGFSKLSHCPDTSGQINYCTGWHTPNKATADYYHQCQDTAAGPAHNFSTSSAYFGYQGTADSAYAGIFAYYGAAAQIREYVAASIPALQPGEEYKVSLRISLADSSNYAANGMGVFFYANGKPDTNFYQVYGYNPQIEYGNYGAVTDKTVWTELTDTFMADSAYTHILIGNFLADGAQTRVHTPSPGQSFGPISYYYIDSVSIEHISTASIRNVNAQEKASLYPNPFTDQCQLRIKHRNADQYCFTLYNLQGKAVRTIDNILTDQLTIDRAGLAPGVYYYQLTSRGNVLQTGRLTAW